MKNLTIYSLFLTAATLTGTAAAYDCSYAEQDLQRLHNEKQSTLDLAVKGVSAILPLGAAIHVIEGNEAQTLKQVSTDDYNRSLDLQIQQIKATCGLD